MLVLPRLLHQSSNFLAKGSILVLSPTERYRNLLQHDTILELSSQPLSYLVDKFIHACNDMRRTFPDCSKAAQATSHHMFKDIVMHGTPEKQPRLMQSAIQRLKTDRC